LYALRRAASASSGEEWPETGDQSRDENASAEGETSASTPAAVKPLSPRKEELTINSFLEADSADVLAALSQSSRILPTAKEAEKDINGGVDVDHDFNSSQEGSVVFRD